MTYDQYLKKYSRKRWRAIQRERKRKPFESDHALDNRLMVESMVRRARRLIRKYLA